MSNLVTVTNSVFKRVSELMTQEKSTHSTGLRISVEAGGCSGLQYKYELTDQSRSDDVVIEQNNVRIYIDSKSAQFMQNSQLNFVEELGASYFEVKNPNAASKCGCGNSFGI